MFSQIQLHVEDTQKDSLVQIDNLQVDLADLWVHLFPCPPEGLSVQEDQVVLEAREVPLGPDLPVWRKKSTFLHHSDVMLLDPQRLKKQ